MSEDRMSEQWTRLQKVYEDMADEQLLELAAAPEDLTDVAREVLGGEIRRRGLKVVPVEDEPALRQAGWESDEKLVDLMSTLDAFRAAQVCECLKRIGVEFEVRDNSKPGHGLRRNVEDGSAVHLQFFVGRGDLEVARAVLRKEMGLFPQQEVAVADEAVDDGTRASVGWFATRAEADEVAGVLTAAGFWNAVVEDPEADEEARFSVEVREVDLFAAGDAVERALEG